MNFTTNFKSLSLAGVVFAGTVSAIAGLTILPVQALPIIYNPTPTLTLNAGSATPTVGALVNTANGNGLTGPGNALQQQHVAGMDFSNFWGVRLEMGTTPADVNLDFDFGSSVFLDTLALWNYNAFNTTATDRGIKDFTLIPLIQAQYARIDVANNWFVGWTAPGPIGLSEVRFAQTVPVPESSSGLGLLALGLLGTAAAFRRH